MSSSKARIQLSAQDSGCELQIVDTHFAPVEDGFGALSADLPPGIYKVRARVGNDRIDRLVVVREGTQAVHLQPVPISSPIPLPDTANADARHEEHLAHAMARSPRDHGFGAGAALLLCVRGLGKDRASRAAVAGLRLRSSAGAVLYDFADPIYLEDDPGISTVFLGLEPGSYVLSDEGGGRPVAMAVPALQGWQTQVFMFAAHDPLRRRIAPDFTDRAMVMAPLGAQLADVAASLRRQERTRLILTHRRPLSFPHVFSLVRDPSPNPMECLLAAYLLGDPSRQSRLASSIAAMVARVWGKQAPDVIALRAAAGEPPEGLHRQAAVLPPVLRASWRLLTRRPDLFGVGSPLRSVSARVVSQGIWFGWEPKVDSVGLLHVPSSRYAALPASAPKTPSTDKSLLAQLAGGVVAYQEPPSYLGSQQLSPLQRSLFATIELIRAQRGEVRLTSEDIVALRNLYDVPAEVLNEELAGLAAADRRITAISIELPAERHLTFDRDY